VAVEVDGPDHFTCNTPHTLLGSSTAKHQCLQARGWVVLAVPFHEWNAITAQFAAQRPGQQASAPQPDAATADAKFMQAAIAAARSVGVPAELAWQLAAARADYLRAALDIAVKCSHYPRIS
jgi:hypothetical protein